MARKLPPLATANVLTTKLRGPPLSCAVPSNWYEAIRSCIARSSLWITNRWVHAPIPQGHRLKLYPMSLTLIARAMPLETIWPQQFPLVKLPQQPKVAPLVRNSECPTPSLTVFPLGESAKKSLRKCCMRDPVLMGSPRDKLRESVSTRSPLPLRMQTPRCRPLVKSHEPYMVKFAISVYR